MAINELIERHQVEHVTSAHIRYLLEDLDRKQWQAVLAKFDASLAPQQQPASTVPSLEAEPNGQLSRAASPELAEPSPSSLESLSNHSLPQGSSAQPQSSTPQAEQARQVEHIEPCVKKPRIEPELKVTSQVLGPTVAIATKSILPIDTLWKAHWQWFSRNQ